MLAGLILCASAYGQTADDCITRFEQLRGEFEAAAAANGRPDLVCGADSGQPQIERWCREVSL